MHTQDKFDMEASRDLDSHDYIKYFPTELHILKLFKKTTFWKNV